MCCWRRSRVLWIRKHSFWGGFVDRRAWTLLGKQQRFDEGLISEMAWWFSLLWRPNKAALPKSATRYPVLFQTRRIRVDYDFGRLDSGKRFSLELNRESWCLQRTRDVFYNSYIPALDPALISDSTVKKNSMNLWSVLYFWVRQALWCKCTLRTLWGGSKSYITLISFSFIVCFWINARAWKKAGLDLLKSDETYSLQAPECKCMQSTVIYEMQSTIYKANRNRHCIFSTATRGAIENKRKPASSMTSFLF